jgi:hypothetical protein
MCRSRGRVSRADVLYTQQRATWPPGLCLLWMGAEEDAAAWAESQADSSAWGERLGERLFCLLSSKPHCSNSTKVSTLWLFSPWVPNGDWQNPASQVILLSVSAASCTSLDKSREKWAKEDCQPHSRQGWLEQAAFSRWQGSKRLIWTFQPAPLGSGQETGMSALQLCRVKPASVNCSISAIDPLFYFIFLGPLLWGIV